MNVIIGAGAGGLFLGSLLKKDYLIIEHNPQIGAKIKISGGGKCNITNKFVSEKNYYGDIGFVREVLKRFSNKDLLLWLKQNNLPVKMIKNNQYFLESSEVLLNHFRKTVKNVKLNTEVLEVKDDLTVVTDKGEFKAKNLIVASGGVSFKKLGASPIGYKIAEKFGHEITPFKPALVGLTVQPSEAWFKNLSGISVFAKVKVGDKEFRDNILFSHRGITGPAILNASLWWEKGKITIDFLQKDVFGFLKNQNRQISTQLPLPKRFVKEFLKAVGLEDKKVKLLSNKEKEKLKLLNAYEFAPAGTFGFERAEVTKGGVKTDMLDVSMQSKNKKGLYFIGEVTEVTGELGGYNFQWAFSSAYSAYRSLI